MTAVVVASEVSFVVRGRPIVEGISLSLEAGRLTLAVGPNGAGKSTLLKLLTGEFACSRGAVAYGDTDIRRLPPWRLASLRAVMAQATRIAFPFSVYEVVRLGVDGVGRRLGRARREGLVGEALARAGLLHLAARPYESLSGGEQQRVQFARALCQLLGGRSPDTRQVLFLDEPTASLDLTHQLALLDHVRELARSGLAVFVILHDLNLAAAYADHLVVLQSGRLAMQGRPGEVLTNRLLAKVFHVDAQIGELPRQGAPFFLPHRHAERGTSGSSA